VGRPSWRRSSDPAITKPARCTRRVAQTELAAAGIGVKGGGSGSHLHLGRHSARKRDRKRVMKRGHVGATRVQRCDVREWEALAVELRMREGAREVGTERRAHKWQLRGREVLQAVAARSGEQSGNEVRAEWGLHGHARPRIQVGHRGKVRDGAA